MCCAITIHLWLVITRRKINQTKRNERWYYIIPFTLAISLSAALATIPNSAYRIPNRCLTAVIPSKEYLGIRWGLYYGWFIIASVISLLCMTSVLISARRLTHTTHLGRRRYPASTEAYRSEVNARANSKRLRSLVFYTIAYPSLSIACNFPQLIIELLATVLKRELIALRFVALLLLYSEGFFMALVFFFYPAVMHSVRDINHTAVQYWVIEQEEFWRQRQQKPTFSDGRIINEEPSEEMMDKRDIRNFTSWQGRLYHFILTKTPEGNRASILKLRRSLSATLPEKSRPARWNCSGSDSDSDLPDASSLLKSPMACLVRPPKKQKTASHATVIESPQIAVCHASKARAMPKMLVKSASAVLPETEADVDTDNEENIDNFGTIKVPGELVLTIWRQRYYPARVLSRLKGNKYKIEFFDGSIMERSRSSMLTMYDKKFKTCRLGQIQLAGDVPVKDVGVGRIHTCDLDKDFELGMKTHANLVKQVEAIREHLDRLHQCSAEDLLKMSEIEPRLATFFGSDQKAKRQLAVRVSSGFLNRAEFDFLGCLLGRWYSIPPRACTMVPDLFPMASSSTLVEETCKSSDKASAQEAAAMSPRSDHTDATEIVPSVLQHADHISLHSSDNLCQDDSPSQLKRLQHSSQALSFVYDVLLPHAIKRLTIERENCTLEESEHRIIETNNEKQWVYLIMAARGISLDQHP
ncbi:hypothetical protein IW150_000336 [Coemansia sp. RSA 2607]|nr:hypothetical protein IW150_000336 [Coemansia sp. RSA 2607]